MRGLTVYEFDTILIRIAYTNWVHNFDTTLIRSAYVYELRT